jgi:uncharacterized protein (DUF2062 family)
MPRKLFKRWLPDQAKVRDTRSLQFLGTLLHDPNLFHLNRHSVSVAFAVGLFLAFLPIPGQVPLAALLALWLRCNLPLSVALVWISNPLTFPVIFFAAYKVGLWFLDAPYVPFSFELSWDWFTSKFLRIWKPLLLGSVIFSVFFSAGGYLLIQGLWRWSVVNRWQKRPRNK